MTVENVSVAPLTTQEILAAIADAMNKSEGKTVKSLLEDRIVIEDGEITEGVDGHAAAEILKEVTREWEPETLSRELEEVIKLIYFDGGGGGQGEDSPQVVWEFQPTKQLVGFQGWYASHYGTDWDNDFQEWEVYMQPSYSAKR